MLVAGFPAGSFQTNCYVVASAAGEACVVVDPGQDAVEPLEALLAEHRLTPVAVLLTHGHFDHTFSVAPVCDGHDIPAWIHPDDREMLADPMKGMSTQASAFFGGKIELREPKEVRTLDDGGSLELAGLTLGVSHTPGHTEGSVIFTLPTDEGVEVIIAGDTLFAGSIGRTDLPGGDFAKMQASLRDRILTLDDTGVVLPGHGPTTTIGRERASNPYLQDLGTPAPGAWNVTAVSSERERVASFAAPKGIPEYYPPESAGFEHIRTTLLTAADRAGYGLIELPVFEDTGLYARGVGESTDVVSKEMYTFADRGERSVTLRPEGTAGVVRSVIEHGLDRAGLPVKLRYAGPFFRYERPQAGRYRQLQQVGVEAIGVDDPALDAEVIAIADEGFRALGLTGYRLELTSLGDAECRPAYRDLLQEFLAGLDLDEPTRARASLNLRVLDDKRPEVKAQMADAPLLLDHLSATSAEHHAAVLAHLDALGVAYVQNPRMVRGLDYYTKTTFEFVHDGLGAQSGIGGGGRYDGLMATLGGQALSGVGYGIGVDRTLLACRAEGLTPWSEARCEVFGVPLGDAAQQRLVVLAGQLRKAGVRVDLSYGGRGLKGAMKSADRSGARFALVLGDRDLEAGTVGVKDLTTGAQESVELDAVLADLLTASRDHLAARGVSSQRVGGLRGERTGCEVGGEPGWVHRGG